MKNILIVTMIIAGSLASVASASAIDNLTVDSPHWALDAFNTGIR